MAKLSPLLFGGLLLVGSPVVGQQGLRSQDLLSLQGRGCAVRYTLGGLDRAHHVLRRLELLSQYFRSWNEVPTPTVVYLLGRETWEGAELPGIYGVPLRIGASSVALPAEGDVESVRFWRRQLAVDALPMIPGVPLRGTPEEAATMAIADVFLQVEAARGFVQRAGLFGRQAWVAELMAHTCAQIIFARHESERLREIAATYRRLGAQLGGPAAHSLADFQPGLPLLGEESLELWLWFQAQFYSGAERILEDGGKKTVKRLIRASSQAGGRLPEQELLRLYPELGSWIRSSFSTAP